MTLRRKLLLAQAPLAAVLAVLGAIALRTLTHLGRSSERILQDNYRSVLAAQRMNEALERIDRAAVFRALGRRDLSDAQAAPNLERFEDELRVQDPVGAESGDQRQVTAGDRADRHPGVLGERVLPPRRHGGCFLRRGA